MEIWKAIPNTNDKILVSNYGRIKSLLRDERILKIQLDNKGYERIRITINRHKLSLKVHREVAKAFIDNPNNLPQVNHKDGNKTNNYYTNLEWITNIDNARHAIENNLWENVFKASRETNEKRKKPVIATNIHSGETIYFSSINEAERHLNTQHIYDIIKGKRMQAKGYTFAYAPKGGDFPYELKFRNNAKTEYVYSGYCR